MCNIHTLRRLSGVGVALVVAAIAGCSRSQQGSAAVPTPSPPLAAAAAAEEPVTAAAQPTPQTSSRTHESYLAEVNAALQRSEAVVERGNVALLKQATVFVHSLRSTGSGFLFRYPDASSTLIATNHHVVASSIEYGAPIQVTLGSGTPDSTTYDAELLASSESDDLAILRLPEGSSPGAAFLKLAPEDSVSETEPIVVAGFPFGEGLTGRSSPAPTIATGTVSSLRYDADGRLERIQLDADINPGNSGGPVIDRSGTVIGVAVETITTTDISFIIPVSTLHRILEGAVTDVAVRLTETRITVVMTLADPLMRLFQAGFNLVPSPPQDTSPRWPYREFGRRAANGGAVGRRELTLEAPLGSGTQQWIQCWYENRSGRHRLRPVPLSRLGSPAHGPRPGEWLGPAAAGGAIAGEPSALPTSSRALLAMPPRQVADVQVRDLFLPAADLVPKLLWNGDGSAFFVATKSGIVRRVSFPEFREQAKLDVGSHVSDLGRSQQGLLVVLPDAQEVWVLDATTLRPKRQAASGGGSRVASSPFLDLAFVPAENGDFLSVLDLSRGRVTAQVRARDFTSIARTRKHPDGLGFWEFGGTAVTPDGQYLLTISSECLHRFRIAGGSLRYEEGGPRITMRYVALEISPDSLYVGLPQSSISHGLSGHPAILGSVVPVYRVENLREPVMVLQPGSRSETLSFNPRAGVIYTHTHDHQLMVFGSEGVLLKQYDLSPPAGRTIRVAAHPEGKGVLVLTAEKLMWAHPSTALRAGR